jgi:DNA-binding transcriptional MerR regulator
MHPLDDEDAPRFAVGQVAEMLDVQPAFVRRLDSEEVVQPARSAGGQRRYSRADIDQVRRVAEMADAGMTLVGIRRIFELEVELAEVRVQLARAQARLKRKEDRR